MTTPAFRPATIDDFALVRDFIIGLATHEGRPEDVTGDPADLKEALFGARPLASTYLCEVDGEVCAFAIVYTTFATFSAAASLYVEDLYVIPEARGRGIGRAFMTFLHDECRRLGYRSLDWSVLKSNDSGIAFYKSLAARRVDAWDHYAWDC